MKDVMNILENQINCFHMLQENLEEQLKCVKENRIFELDTVGIKINNICKNVAELEISLRKVLKDKAIKDFVMENMDNTELYDSYIFLISQVEKLILMKEDNTFLIRKSLNFTNKLLSAIDNNTIRINVYKKSSKY